MVFFDTLKMNQWANVVSLNGIVEPFVSLLFFDTLNGRWLCYGKKWEVEGDGFFIFSRHIPHPSIHAYCHGRHGGGGRGYHLSTHCASVPIIYLSFLPFGSHVLFYSTLTLLLIFPFIRKNNKIDNITHIMLSIILLFKANSILLYNMQKLCRFWMFDVLAWKIVRES